MKMLRLAIISFIVFFSSCTLAAQELYVFNSTFKKDQFQQLIQELRCLVCQNQNLADSNAPLAKDLRAIIYQRIKSGESNTSIKNYLVSRYGEFILFDPPFYPLTYVLWVSPFILLFIILFSLIRVYK